MTQKGRGGSSKISILIKGDHYFQLVLIWEHSQWTVGRMSPFFGSMDASTDSLNLGRRMYPPTLIFGSVHASTDSKIESADASINSLFGSVDASTDSIIRVGGCIHRPKKYFLSLWMHPPTKNLESADASTDPKTTVGGCIHQPKN